MQGVQIKIRQTTICFCFMVSDIIEFAQDVQAIFGAFNKVQAKILRSAGHN